ncbi:MAG: M2 family metallopeptidase [Armatimonadota bacterium]
MQKRIVEFLEMHVNEVRPLAKETALAWWVANVTGSEEAFERAALLQAQLMKVYAREDEYRFLRQIPADNLTDPLLRRQHKLLLDEYRGRQMSEKTIDEIVQREKEIEKEYNTYRALFRGECVSDNTLREVLHKSDDGDERREAWEASKQIGERVADAIRELVRIRNREARRLGFRDYYAMQLELQELDEARLFNLLEELHRLSDAPFRRYKEELGRRLAERFGVAVEDLRPWHYTDPFFQSPPPGEVDLNPLFEDTDIEAVCRRFYTDVGLPVDPILERSDLYEREGKSQHAFCIDIDREGDVRVLCNLRPSERWMGTMLHELGHAVYDYYINRSLPYLLRTPAHTLSTEAIAMLFGRMHHNAWWLKRYVGISDEQAQAVAQPAIREMQASLIVFTRWVLVMTHFERALYADPDGDMDNLWWQLVEKYQWLRKPEGRVAPDWAAKVHIALAPVYYQNYILGEMEASQILHVLRTQVLAGEPEDALVRSSRLGEFLKERVFVVGASLPWEDALEYATGEKLNPAYFVAQMGAESPI